MRLTFLGTGAAGGVPLWGCDCPACKRAAWVRDHRRAPCCAVVEAGGERILIDAGLPDLAERFPAGTLSRILLTHYHPDHVQGLFHLRWGVGKPLPVFGPPDSEGCADLYKNPGILDFRRLRKFEPLVLGAEADALTVTPVPLIHSKPTLGFCIEADGKRLAYLTDTVGLPPTTREFLQGFRPDALVLDCTHAPASETPRNHNDLTQAVAIAEEIAAPCTRLTHISHELDARLISRQTVLPDGVAIARDGEVLEI